jgi:hypothetical protein
MLTRDLCVEAGLQVYLDILSPRHLLARSNSMFSLSCL